MKAKSYSLSPDKPETNTLFVHRSTTGNKVVDCNDLPVKVSESVESFSVKNDEEEPESLRVLICSHSSGVSNDITGQEIREEDFVSCTSLASENNSNDDEEFLALESNSDANSPASSDTENTQSAVVVPQKSNIMGSISMPNPVRDVFAVAEEFLYFFSPFYLCQTARYLIKSACDMSGCHALGSTQ